MSRLIDMTGKVYGKLTIIRRAGNGVHKNGAHSHATWECACECGNTVVTDGVRIRSKMTQSCGCLKRRGRPDLLLEYHKVKVIKVCDCGKEYTTSLACSGIVVRCQECKKKKQIKWCKQNYIKNKESILQRNKKHRDMVQVNKISAWRQFCRDYDGEMELRKAEYTAIKKKKKNEADRKRHDINKEEINRKRRENITNAVDVVIKKNLTRRFNIPAALISKELIEGAREELLAKRKKMELVKFIREQDSPVPEWAKRHRRGGR